MLVHCIIVFVKIRFCLYRCSPHGFTSVVLGLAVGIVCATDLLKRDEISYAQHLKFFSSWGSSCFSFSTFYVVCVHAVLALPLTWYPDHFHGLNMRPWQKAYWSVERGHVKEFGFFFFFSLSL